MNLVTQIPPAQQQVLAAFVLAGLLLIGWGSVFRWLCGFRVRDVDDLYGAFFEGWALLLGERLPCRIACRPWCRSCSRLG